MCIFLDVELVAFCLTVANKSISKLRSIGIKNIVCWALFSILLCCFNELDTIPISCFSCVVRLDVAA